ncbi:MAG: hypothetical protein LC748_10125 [Thermomicrobia bacterium]|nr:hypothetical protein [Thermomicrobia bacterium]
MLWHRITLALRRAIAVPILRYNGIFFLSTALMGLANYLLGTTAARRFMPGNYSQLGVMLNLIAAFSPISGAIGGAIIRRASLNRTHDNHAETDAVQRTLNGYLVTLHVLLLGAVFLAHGTIVRYLHLTATLPLYLVAVTSLFAFMFGLLQGILQERGTYGRLSLILLGESVFRCIAGVAAISLGFGVTGVVFVYAISAALVIVVLPRPRALWTGERAPWRITRPILRDVGQLALANFCVAALVNLDVVLCRHYLAPVSADRYVALAALAKFFLYATGSISSIAFAEVIKAIHRGESNNRLLMISLGLIVGLGILFVAFCAITGPIVMTFAFGSAFRPSGSLLWITAISAFAISVINLEVAYYNAYGWLWYLPMLALGSVTTVVSLPLAGTRLVAYTSIYAAGTTGVALILFIPMGLKLMDRITLGKAMPAERSGKRISAVG